MSGSCPTCGREIDPLRAPVARVVGGRIIAYCSGLCAEGKPLPPAAKVVSPVAHVSSTAAAAVTAPVAAPSTKPAAGAVAPSASISATARAELVDPDEPRTIQDHRRRRNRRVLWLSVGIVVGGMAFAIIQAVSPSSPGPVSAERDKAASPADGDAGPVVEDPAEVPPPDPTPPSPEEVRTRAISELRALLPSPSTRIAREAARALARTGDPEAIALLVKQLAVEESSIAKLDIAYALARGGDARGVKFLVAHTTKGRRDVKADAARYLALLGDKRGITVLEDMLDAPFLRLGAAEALSRLGHKGGLAALEFVRHNEKAKREDRLRALVSLGRAGRADVAEDLRAVLGDGQFNVGAAEALARLGDQTAAPVLIDQLDVPSLQVGAALGLRRLDPELDPRPLLPALVAALASGKDTARVTAAEAILILTGPAELAERD